MPDKHLKTALLLAERSRQCGDYNGAVEICSCAIRLATSGNAIDDTTKGQLSGVLQSAVQREDRKAAADALIEALAARTGTPPQEDGPSEVRALIVFYTNAAISMGAPAYNQRDHAGCHEVYAATARMLIETGKLPADAVARLQQGLSEASAADNSDKAAWAMRHALDDVRAPRSTRPTVAPGPSTDRPRGQEPNAGVASMKDMVRAAISIGAPIYDAGDPRGCFEIYATVARFLLRVSSPAPSVSRGHLKQALEESALMTSARDQAWALRRALDRVLVERDLDVLPTTARAPLRTRSPLVRLSARVRRQLRPTPVRKHRQRR